MNEDINIYRVRKLVYAIIFDFYDNDYKEEPGMFDLIILESLKNIVEAHVENGDLSNDVISNINNYLEQARDFKDENRSKRIEIINEIIITMNKQDYDNLLLFYRIQLMDRRKNFKYGINYSSDEIKAEMNNVHESICHDLVVIESHSEDVSDEEFVTEYLPDLTNSSLYYESLNMILKENPSVFKDRTFYNRMMCILNLNNEINNVPEMFKINKKLVKNINRQKKKY